MSANESVNDDIKKMLIESANLGFTELSNDEDWKKCVEAPMRSLIDLDTVKQQVLFNGYIELNRLSGLLLIEPETKVLALVLPAPECYGENGDEHWFETQLGRVNMLHYILKQECKDDYCDFTVEVLFVVKSDDAVKRQLSRLVNTTQLIHLVSINYLIVTDDKPVDGDQLKKALPWLLIDYSKWCGEARVDDAPILDTIKTSNYRLADERMVKFNPNTNIHLFHGHNGSGKSTLAETIELLNRGKIERLCSDGYSQKEYSAVVVHPDAKDCKSSIDYCFSGVPNPAKPATIIIGQDEYVGPKENNIRSESFMLNQAFIDKLINQGPKERYGLFYSAFFDLDIDEYKAYEKRRADIDKWGNVLWTRLQCKGDYDDSRLLGAVSNILTDNARHVQMQFLLPIEGTNLALLAKVEPAIAPLLKSLQHGKKLEQFKSVVQKLNKPLTDICSQTNLFDDLLRAGEILTLYDEWWFQSKESDESFEQLFDQWSALQARIDLLTKRLQLSKLNRLTSIRRELDEIGITAPLVLDDAEEGRLNETLVDNRQQLTQVKQSLAQNFNVSTKTKVKTKQIDVPMLTNQQIKLLNNVGKYLVDKSDGKLQGLGYALAMMINNQQHGGACMKALKIDEENWGGPLKKQLKELSEAVKALESAESHWQTLKIPSLVFGANGWLLLSELAIEQLTEITKVEHGYEQKFLGQLVELEDAINELLSIFTPSRWLYKRLKIHRFIDSEMLKLTLGENTDPASSPDATLIWNTAELNLMAVALFLLCANRTKNTREITTLVMDDPLQNMDELTSVYFARGLSKLNTFWRKQNKNQQVIMLFHGEQAIESFSQVLPAAVYKLPWPGQSQTIMDERGEEFDYKKADTQILGKLLTFVKEGE